MAQVYVSIGSNIDKRQNVRSACSSLAAAFGKLNISSVYRTTAVGFKGADFYNLAAGFESGMPPEALCAELRRIENEHGRKRGKDRFSSRRLDLDLLLYDDLVVDRKDLRLPHDDITRYAFVLRPLAQIAGSLRHPKLGTPLRELLDRSRLAHEPMEEVELDLNGIGRPG